MSEPLFARHLDLTPLGRRRRGKVRCIFHDERTASLSVDVDRGIFHCFGCGTSGGRRRFAELVGEVAPIAAAPRAYTSPLAEARAAVLAEARRQPWARMVEHYEAARWVRAGFRRVHEMRGVGHELGDSERGWELLATAADVERAVLELEATL